MSFRASFRKNQERQAFPIKVQNLNTEIKQRKTKKPRHLRKDPFNAFYKETPKSFKPTIYNKILDGFLLLEASKLEMPNEVVTVQLRGEGISDVVEEDLKYFTSLAKLDLSDNCIDLGLIRNLESLTDLTLMCNKITQIPELSFPSFRCLETLNLSFNCVSAQTILNLGSLPRLSILDLSNNDLCTLPEDLSYFKALQELKLGSNGFSSDSVLFSASLLFRALASIPSLQKLDLDRNKLRGIHSEALNADSFLHLKELDFSYNWVDSEENLYPAADFQTLQVLTVTGNPFAKKQETEELENLLLTNLSATVINEFPMRKTKRPPYARPIAYVTQDYNAALKNQLFGVELSKNMGTIPISEMNSNSEMDEEVFPPAIENKDYKDIYTPSNDRESAIQTRGSGQNQLFFITEAESKKNPNKQFPSKLDKFRELCKQFLGNNKDYDSALDLQQAYRQLKHAIQYPMVFQEKQEGPRYTKFTASRSKYSSQVNPKYYSKPSKEKLPVQKLKQELQRASESLEEPFNRIQTV